MYEVIFYEDARGRNPVDAFVKSLDKKAKGNKDARIQMEQFTYQVDLLERLGTRAPSDVVKPLRDGIWELRPGKNRVLLCSWNGNHFVLLHQFRKETGKTPPEAIERAKKRMQDWTRRHGQ